MTADDEDADNDIDKADHLVEDRYVLRMTHMFVFDIHDAVGGDAAAHALLALDVVEIKNNMGVSRNVGNGRILRA